ncbi:L-piperidine-6-carboxylate dehydrogenase [Membranihabitans maritimus]|uniref:L-piperidine-6-carboxylate dehydrogenase n=1 Tax=Membranihabitans maritimus TaxID=2904244 RepID=UPI001F35AA9B|nr:aldehyde dehydrogenase family protein [Membranihabitans maritimus]
MISQLFKTFGLSTSNPGTYIGTKSLENTEYISSISPIDQTEIGRVSKTSNYQFQEVIKESKKAFLEWRKFPAPKRGDIIRQYAMELRRHKSDLGKLISVEMGKPIQEGMGEVQEMIDICDFAVGLSRQLYGKTIKSERENHQMYEQWHPLGIVGIISAFNFPVAVWSWNVAIALICGNICIWKPSEKTLFSALACQNLLCKVLSNNNIEIPISNIISGDKNQGKWLAEETEVSLISATGSVRMGREVAATVGKRLGKSILELGGNNAMIVSPNADINLALHAALFGAIGTAGQRCTSTRRLIIHSEIFDVFTEKLKNAYAQVKIGDPLDPNNHMGPLIDQNAVNQYLKCIETVQEQGGEFIIEGGLIRNRNTKSPFYVKPCAALLPPNAEIMKIETFAPVLYLIKYTHLEEAISYQNNVRQGLSSSIITNNLQEAQKFLSPEGSDCGIANVNIGTSGAEIGGAFGGEKDTGGGRESGSDAWKAYMRRQTTTINYGDKIPLAQGIKFNL